LNEGLKISGIKSLSPIYEKANNSQPVKDLITIMHKVTDSKVELPRKQTKQISKVEVTQKKKILTGLSKESVLKFE
jgi:uncharacterized membrane protein